MGFYQSPQCHQQRVAREGPWNRQGDRFPRKCHFGVGNGGVTTKIINSYGSIGYVEYGFAKRASLAMALLENKTGNFIEPNESSSTLTLVNTASSMPASLRLFLPDPAGETSYPIVPYSWLLLHKHYEDKNKERKLKEFVLWGVTKGQQLGQELGYAPLPKQVTDAAVKALKTIN